MPPPSLPRPAHRNSFGASWRGGRMSTWSARTTTPPKNTPWIRRSQMTMMVQDIPRLDEPATDQHYWKDHQRTKDNYTTMWRLWGGIAPPPHTHSLLLLHRSNNITSLRSPRWVIGSHVTSVTNNLLWSMTKTTKWGSRHSGLGLLQGQLVLSPCQNHPSVTSGQLQ